MSNQYEDLEMSLRTVNDPAVEHYGHSWHFLQPRGQPPPPHYIRDPGHPFRVQQRIQDQHWWDEDFTDVPYYIAQLAARWLPAATAVSSSYASRKATAGIGRALYARDTNHHLRVEPSQEPPQSTDADMPPWVPEPRATDPYWNLDHHEFSTAPSYASHHYWDRQDHSAETLPPLRPTRGPHTIPVSEGKFETRMPTAITVNLHSVVDTCGYRDTVNPRSYDFYPSRLYRPWNNLRTVMGDGSSTIPDWVNGSATLNAIYAKHRVIGFKIKVTVMPYPYAAEMVNSCAYIDQGYYQASPSLATLVGMSQWKSQPGAQHQMHAKVQQANNPPIPQYVYDFPYIDCYRDFGESVASDNRLDWTYDAQRVVAADPKDYGFHICWRMEPYPNTGVGLFVPWFTTEMDQRVVFYEPRSNVDA